MEVQVTKTPLALIFPMNLSIPGFLHILLCTFYKKSLSGLWKMQHKVSRFFSMCYMEERTATKIFVITLIDFQ